MMDNQNTNQNSIPKSYDPKVVEKKIYKMWEDSGYFNPDKMIEDYEKRGEKVPQPFVIPLPPPNANDNLHLGHVSGYTYQDIMGRYNRMLGRPTLLLPGKDHAGIQTEVVFEKQLAKKKIKKRELGREEFYKQCYEFCMMNAGNARNQEKKIGLSADYSREKFTLDPDLTDIVMETFEKMFNEGLIYRGSRVINWCVRCQTALANIDTEHTEKEGILAHIKYPIKDTDEFIEVATTRPETMLGDTAVAVNPKDEKYKDLIGKTCIIPFVNREVPIIADYRIDMEFGTGAVKVTPAHSPIDYEIGKDHNLEEITVIDKYGRMTNEAGEKYAGMKVKACREQLLKDLEKEGLLVRVESYHHAVTTCERCGSEIEPLIQMQWFVNVQKIKQGAIDAVKKEQTKIYPKTEEKVYSNWMENLNDWCISRQLWWGHQIPIWYCGGRDLHDELIDNPEATGAGCGNAFYHYGKEKPVKCPQCGGTHLEQDPDVFDTWFSSAQWPYTTLGGLEGEDYKKFYPTDVLATGRDILFFWVARMMMMGIYKTGKPPFHSVYLYGLVTDKHGQKMSKSKGNGIDPTEMIEKYGTDALRYSFVFGNSPGQSYRLYEEKINGFKKFINKIWNGSRFALMQFENLSKDKRQQIAKQAVTIKGTERLDSLNNYIIETTRLLDEFRFGIAAEELYNFWWHIFCDKYIEEIKSAINDLGGHTELDSESREKKNLKLLAELLRLLITQLKLLHPFIPFVTEEIWQILKSMNLIAEDVDMLMISTWPKT